MKIKSSSSLCLKKTAFEISQIGFSSKKIETAGKWYLVCQRSTSSLEQGSPFWVYP